MNYFSIYQGDSSSPITIRPYIVDPTEVISDDWVCKSRLIGEDDTEYVAPRIETVKTDDGLLWVVTLSPEDTIVVPVLGKFTRCKWVIQVTNNTLSPIYNREKHIHINVKKQGLI